MIFRRIIFQVGILNHHDGCGRPGKPRAQRRALALIVFVPHQGHPRIAARGRLQFFPGAVRGSVIHHDQLLHRALRQHDFDHFHHCRRLVIDRHHDRKARLNVGVGFNFVHLTIRPKRFGLKGNWQKPR